MSDADTPETTVTSTIRGRWTPTQDDLRELLRGSIQVRVMTIYGVIVALAGLPFAPLYGGSWWVVVALGVICTLAPVWVPPVRARQAWALPTNRAPKSLLVDEQGITIGSKLMTTRYNWAAIAGVRETSRLFVLVLGKGAAQILVALPHRAMSDDDRKTFHEIVAANLARTLTPA